jgi:protease PrsW
MLNLGIALVPVAVFLVALARLDTFRLVRPTAIARALAFGAGAAVVSLAINEWLLRSWQLSLGVVAATFAPLIEETLKSVLLVALIATARVGFLVDAAVEGFAVGTGFAIVENIWYVQTMPNAGVALWIVRGLGTAVLQGATTTIFAVVSRAMDDRHRGRWLITFLPGWLAAVALHAAFNVRVLPPFAEMLALLITLPLAVVIVFERSERATREWIGAGLDLDVELLQLMTSAGFPYTRFGRYLQQLRERTGGWSAADMFCLLRLELELSVQAKAMLLARENGLELPPDPDLEGALSERQQLHRSIGKAGLLALQPLQVSSHRDRWHRHLLRGAARSA